MLTFAEEFILLSLDEKSGDFRTTHFMSLEYGIVGAILMELQILNRLDSDPDRLWVVDASPTGQEEFDRVISMIRSHDREESPQWWIKEIGRQCGDFKDSLITRLVDRGILKVQDKRVLWVFPTRKYPLIDNREVMEVRARIRALVMSDDIPEPRDIILIALMRACELEDAVFTGEERKEYRARIDHLSRMDLVGQSLLAALQELMRWLRASM